MLVFDQNEACWSFVELRRSCLAEAQRGAAKAAKARRTAMIGTDSLEGLQ